MHELVAGLKIREAQEGQLRDTVRRKIHTNIVKIMRCELEGGRSFMIFDLQVNHNDSRRCRCLQKENRIMNIL